MLIDKKTNYGKINISLDAIASIVGESIKNVFGVVGLGSKRTLQDNLNVLFNKETYKDGVVVKKEKDKYIVDIYVVLSYGVKVSEVLSELVEQVRYNLQKAFDVKFKTINCYVQDIQ